jgi:hypothetical protein
MKLSWSCGLALISRVGVEEHDDLAASGLGIAQQLEEALAL